MNKKFIKILAISLMISGMMACGDDGDAENDGDNNPQNTEEPSQSTSDSDGDNPQNQNSTTGGTSTDWKNGYVTTYNKSGDYPWPIEKYVGIEEGYYKCAPSYGMITDYIYGTCYEITYKDDNNKSYTIKVLGDDECPDGDNTYIDLELDGFKALTNGLTTGKPNVTWREIPYYTNKNLTFQVKSGSNEWFLGCWIFNGRYPVTKVEISADNKTFYAMKEQNQRKEFFELQVPTALNKYPSTIYVRATDKHNHQVVGEITISDYTQDKSYDMGMNFDY